MQVPPILLHSEVSFFSYYEDSGGYQQILWIYEGFPSFLTFMNCFKAIYSEMTLADKVNWSENKKTGS